MNVKLKTTQVKAYREKMLAEQGGVCALTHYPLALGDAVLDHDHATGLVRGVIHRGANSLLGKLENNHKRYGVSKPMLFAIGRNLEVYLTRSFESNPLHPTHKTDDEKRLVRNAKARAARAKKKEQS